MEYVKAAFYILVLVLCFLTTYFTMRVMREREEAVKLFAKLSAKLQEANEKMNELNKAYEERIEKADGLIEILEQIVKYGGGENEKPG